MRDRITLPRLLGFRLKGFQPIFQDDVAMSLRSGPNIILGGNGLGKTTIVQAVVYGLTGGAGANVEDEKRFRWDHSYFRGRLHASQARSAQVEIDFAFGDKMFSVRRGFSGSDVTAFRIGPKGAWTEDGRSASLAFHKALRQYGGYHSPEDFAFLVNRLLYLPETRRLVAWDTNAQVRLLMLLNQDVAREEDFRQRRVKLRLLDSRKRHIHVALGKAEKHLAQLMEYDEENSSDEGPEVAAPQTQEQELPSLVARLKDIMRKRSTAENEMQAAAQELDSVSTEVESLREQVEVTEASLVESFLAEQERESALPLYNLLENGSCPVCGTRQPELQALAQRHSRAGLCIICGSDAPLEANPELMTLRSRLSEKLKAQEVLEKDFFHASNKLTTLRDEEDKLQDMVNKARFTEPVVTLLERDLPVTTREGLTRLRASLEKEEADLEAQILKLRNDLEREYKEFHTAISTRIDHLRKLYSDYATAFLGLSCVLAKSTDGDLISLSRFVPKFSDISRGTPESCSEAQRFFLDIAFRMALIDLALSLTGESATFICETPETALDLSYIDNVVKMFGQFSEKGHNLLLSANIQRDGIAKKLLRLVPSRQRRSRVLDMLEVGQLSSVHRGALKTLRAAVRQTIT